MSALPDSRDFPFVHRLPTDVAAQIRGTATTDVALVEMGSPRRRLVVLVLVLGLFGGGLATGLPTAQAMRHPDCGAGRVVDASGDVRAGEHRLC
ncbi:hypothetical protein E4P39_09020 [Blastococcus sp. CT_GayMR19]|uniref:hypothetical protein n=1 Tax=Blastococcus sp. CT_GayMR19 TaxID=2559608 RepID=UPI0010749B97|nr:hypothetical protein [Blastococcus sp. CT_GayMR19]TFV76025.1 hypothetical protein E4P39_09020 [Blastococcus sp. CT_GayMR19]